MDWFERLTGFREGAYAETRDRLSLADRRLKNIATDRDRAVGTLSLPWLDDLRGEVRDIERPGQLRLSIVGGDVRAMHLRPENRNALFQVASQFNMLEMIGPPQGANGPLSRTLK